MSLSWTPEQQALFAALGTGHIIADALAGSAKSTSIEEGIKRLVVARPADSILACAFNRKTADDLFKRLPKNVTVKTLNGMGHGAWSKHINRKLTLETNKLGNIVSDICKDADARELWGDIKALATAARVAGLVPNNAIQGYRSLAADEKETWEDLAEHYDIEYSSDLVAMARQAINVSIKQAFTGLIDFDDQLYMSVCYQAAFQRYDFVFVDEAQDLSPIQHIMVEKSLKMNGKLVAVGDEHQAIYGFRGAATNSIELFKAKFNPQVLPLTICFRCSKEVVKHAQEIVPKIQPFHGSKEGSIKELSSWDEKVFNSGDVIICRNNAPLIAIAFRLIRRGISCHMLGRDLGKGLLSVIKKITNDREDMKLEVFLNQLNSWEKQELLNAEAKKDNGKANKVRDRAESLRAVITFSGCKDISSLKFAVNSLFDRSTGKITLTTAHRSKGLEFEHVFLLDDFLFHMYAKSAWQIQQEDNLKYVQRTRAKDSITYINSEDWEEAGASS